jgi:histidine phosphotransferase ChpT
MNDPASVDSPPPGLQPAPAPEAVSAFELAARIAAKLCHDFISPTSALVSGLDLLEDPASQDMRAEAMDLVTASGRKLEAYLTYYRTAFGGSQATEIFDSRELEKLVRGRFAYARAELDWAVTPGGLDKTPARALLNLAEVGATVLPMGGTARLEVRETPTGSEVTLRAESPRARLHEDVARGLKGEPLGDGLSGRWVQPYFLHTLIAGAGGRLTVSQAEGLVAVYVEVPAEK